MHRSDSHQLILTHFPWRTTFTSSVIDAIGQGKEISLVGFGNFSIGQVAARTGRNPKTQEPLQIPAYNQPKFKAGQKLKDAVNPK